MRFMGVFHEILADIFRFSLGRKGSGVLRDGGHGYHRPCHGQS